MNNKEIEILDAAKKANGKYFDALVEAATIIPQRVGKYSGEEDPYQNFKILTQELSIWFKNRYGHEIDMRDTFMFYHCLKHARLLVSGAKDFKDDSALDGRRDAVNYLAIDLGDMLEIATKIRNEEENEVYC